MSSSGSEKLRLGPILKRQQISNANYVSISSDITLAVRFPLGRIEWLAPDVPFLMLSKTTSESSVSDSTSDGNRLFETEMRTAK